MAAGHSIDVTAAHIAGSTYRQLAQAHTSKMDQGVLLAAEPGDIRTVSRRELAEENR